MKQEIKAILIENHDCRDSEFDYAEATEALLSIFRKKLEECLSQFPEYENAKIGNLRCEVINDFNKAIDQCRKPIERLMEELT